jgi:ribosomal protein S27E
MSVDSWWECPNCGGATEIYEDPPPHRSCSTCDWSVSLPAPDIGDEAEVDDGDP